MRGNYELFVGSSYFYDRERIFDEQTVCIGESYDDVYFYLARLRHYTIVDMLDMDDRESLGDKHVCAAITRINFATEDQALSYLERPGNEPYTLQWYGKVDRYMAGLKKKEAKGVKLPTIVASIIERDVKAFRHELACSSHTLKTLLYYINGFDRASLKIKGDSQLLVNCCDLLDGMVEGQGYDVANDMYERHPILFCDEPEYRRVIKSGLAQRDLDREYHNIIE
jgi:hypothetical protein